KPDGAWDIKSPTLNDLADEFAVDSLTIPQLKRLLVDHNVAQSGLREKTEFVEEVKRLWRTHRHLSSSASCDRTCCVCLNAVPDCALDPCGHVAMCYKCAVELTDCPLCRRHVQRVLRIYFAV
ncbi:E3 ubiquitin-protein ligase RNF34, partial [Paragonimus westermani]